MTKRDETFIGLIIFSSLYPTMPIGPRNGRTFLLYVDLTTQDGFEPETHDIAAPSHGLVTFDGHGFIFLWDELHAEVSGGIIAPNLVNADMPRIMLYTDG